MADQPVLKAGAQNPTDWVTHLQKMLNIALHTPMRIELPETGVFDDATKQAVEQVQTHAGIKVDGIVGEDTWGALWAAVNARQAGGAAPGGESGQAGGGQNEDLAKTDDSPASYTEIDRGREIVHAAVDHIVPLAGEFARRVLDLGEPSEVIPILIDAVATGVHLVEMTGLFAKVALVAEIAEVGGPVVAIVAPFAMWYEAIQANSAGDLHRLRWEIYNPWIDGMLAGLYLHQTRDYGAMFTPVQNIGFNATANLSDTDRRGVIGLLLSASGLVQEVPSATHPNLSAVEWGNRGYQNGWTQQGLQTVINHRDR